MIYFFPIRLNLVAPVGQTTLVPSFGNILSPSSSNQPSSFPVSKPTLENVRKVHSTEAISTPLRVCDNWHVC